MKYCDYFPKSMLYKYNIEPNKKLEIDENLFSKNPSEQNIINSMKEIYSVFKNSDKTNEIISQNNREINRRIVSMFYDLDILKSDDIQKFPLDMKIFNDTKTSNKSDNIFENSQRENLVLEELDIKNINKNTEKSKQVFAEKQKQPLEKGTLKW